jgi:hypothetical protein
MAYRFPKAGTSTAELVTPHTEEMLANPSRVPTLSEARTNARNFLRTTNSGAVGLYSTCMLADDDIAIVYFGIRRAQRIVWNFGKA